MASDYRFAQNLLVRLLGAVLISLGLLLLILAVLVAAFDLPGAVFSTGLALVVVLVVVLGFLLSRVATLVRFDDDGYRVRYLRGAGVKQARWRDVEDAVAADIAGHKCIVLRLRDGRTTTLPIQTFNTTPDAFITDLRAHLDRGRGYRRLN